MMSNNPESAKNRVIPSGEGLSNRVNGGNFSQVKSKTTQVR